ncbi:MAG: DUF2442 domain-containing protein [Verrucomicrobia bacterium]|nr:DUF2442 domain-containing protein [Verrucomicrobiota bacterium]
MHYITAIEYDSGYKLCLQFESGEWRVADLEKHLSGEVFLPLRDPSIFQTVRLNSGIDTVVWDTGADMSPDFLYKISAPIEGRPVLKAAEEPMSYKTNIDK